MSRAVNVDATPAAVEALCAKHDISISTLEALPSGGARVVLRTMIDADAFRSRMGNKVLTGAVVRSGLYLARPPMAPHR
ncbi:hypothetical protein PX699_06535 [Sphingobium sp. H39-3-25]|jgi:hypothetical protein|uniref:hypothetical protein n=1 Tax=Sphingobium TaxID=165695 RepID=UPI0023B9992B|nr:hypothetical protein [Sphingobium arseniciresistens]